MAHGREHESSAHKTFLKAEKLFFGRNKRIGWETVSYTSSFVHIQSQIYSRRCWSWFVSYVTVENLLLPHIILSQYFADSIHEIKIWIFSWKSCGSRAFRKLSSFSHPLSEISNNKVSTTMWRSSSVFSLWILFAIARLHAHEIIIKILC